MLRKTVLLVLALCGAASAGILDKPWAFNALGNDDQIALRAGLRDGKGEVGLEGLWLDGLSGTQEAVGASFYATWDVVDNLEIPFTLPFGTGGGTVTATGYTGAKLGFLVNTDGPKDYDATAAGLVGVRLGGPKILLGFEYQAAITKDVWSVMSDSEKSVLLATITYRLK